MSKIAIISQPEQGVLIDVSGSETLYEAAQHLTSTLNASSQFWNGMSVDLNLGGLVLGDAELNQLQAIAQEMGVGFRQVFAENESTLICLQARGLKVGVGTPTSYFAREAEPYKEPEAELEVPEEGEEEGSVDYLANSIAGPGMEDFVKEKRGIKYGAAPSGPQVMFLRQTLRSGQSVSHKGHLVIVGDVNPGAEVMADGDITVWGALRGVAHAGVSGNIEAQIRALKLRPMQLRIAHAIARAPDRPHNQDKGFPGPETARIVSGQIRISANIPE